MTEEQLQAIEQANEEAEEYTPTLVFCDQLIAEVRRLRDRVCRVEHDFELMGNRRNLKCRDCGLED